MKRSRILSTFRTEFRRKAASYSTEVAALRWVRKFLDYYSVEHSSQIRQWQVEFFIAELKKKEYTVDELFHARSALRFMMDNILHRTGADDSAENESPGVFRVTG